MVEVCTQHPEELLDVDKLSLSENRSSSTDSGYVQRTYCNHIELQKQHRP